MVLTWYGDGTRFSKQVKVPHLMHCQIFTFHFGAQGPKC